MAVKFKVAPLSVEQEHEKQVYTQLRDRVAFNTSTDDHKNLIKKCDEQVQTNLKKLRRLDFALIASVSVGIVASILSFIPLIGLIALAAHAATVFFGFFMRPQASKAYKQSLNNLMGCCEWSLGNVTNPNHADYAQTRGDIFKCADIKSMINTLGPLTTTAQLKDRIDDNIEDRLVDEAKRASSAEDIKLAQMAGDLFKPKDNERYMHNMYYNFYGFEKGSWLNIGSALLEAIKGVVKNIPNPFNKNTAKPTAQGAQQPNATNGASASLDAGNAPVAPSAAQFKSVFSASNNTTNDVDDIAANANLLSRVLSTATQ